MKLCWLLAVGLALPASAQAGSWSMGFHFVRTGVPVPEYTFFVREDGTGEYSAKATPIASGNRYSMTSAPEAVRTLSLNALAIGRLRDLGKAADGLTRCQSREKNVADTGAKTLTVHEADHAEVSCTFNYSEQKQVAELATTFQAMAFTLDEATRMEHACRFDRLALDAEMTLLVEAVKERRAMGLSNIRATLQMLVDDPQVLARVREKAEKLLEQSGVTA